MARGFFNMHKSTLEAKNSALSALALVAIGLLLLVSVWAINRVWYLNQQVKTHESQLRDATSALKAMSENVAKGKDYSNQSKVESLAIDATEAYLSTPGTARTPYEAKTGYMDDSFARVVVSYQTLDPVTGKNVDNGKTDTYFFKKVKPSGVTEYHWAMVNAGGMVTDELIQTLKNRYGMPDKAITGTNNT